MRNALRNLWRLVSGQLTRDLDAKIAEADERIQAVTCDLAAAERELDDLGSIVRELYVGSEVTR